ncbi:MAG: type II secretion system GspH family protein [Acetatifactor sp.]|nr:type II secretion system GspH family protein [Acetatifactor sp.]
MWMKKSRKKLNHRGMTLVEVIVAMAILAVVIVPTLHIFASTSGTNFRAKQRQRATTVAESTMEALKAYSLDNLCRLFDNNDFKGANIYNADGTLAGSQTAKAVDSSGHQVSPFRSDNTLNTDYNEYVLTANKVVSESSYFNVVVNIKPYISTNSASYERNMLQMDSPNKYRDCIINLSELKEEQSFDAEAKLKNAAKDKVIAEVTTGTPTITNSDIKLSNFVRKIELDVNDNGTTQTVSIEITYTADAKVEYQIAGVSQTAKEYTGLKYEVDFSTTPGSTETTKVLYDNSATIAGTDVVGRKSKLDRIFLYYYPTYSEIYGTGAKDEIEVTSNLTGIYAYDSGLTKGDSEALGNYPMELIVAKQRSAYITGDAAWRDAENDYNTKPEITLKNTTNGSGQLVVRHNLNEYIGTGTAPGGIPDVHPTGFSAVEDIMAGMTDSSKLLYKVEVHVYDVKTSEEVALIEGTMND